MDPLIQGIISGVIANALTAIAFHIGSKDRKMMLEHEDSLKKFLEKDVALTTLLQKAPASVAKALKFDDKRLPEKPQLPLFSPDYDKHLADKIRLFLVSPEVDAIVRQIYANQLVTGQKNYMDSIRAEFLVSLSLWLNKPEQSLKDLAGYLFEALLKGCERALVTAIDKGILSAHEARSTIRHRLINDELATIQKNLAFLTAQQKPNIQAILKFEEKYRHQVANRHGYIIPPYFDVARKLPIDDIYVSPNFITSPKKEDEEPKILNVPDFLSVIYRAVLLGNPGSGKSTFTAKLSYDLSMKDTERLFAGRQATPILVVLRDYGADKKAHSYSVLQFIEATANSKYQVKPPPGAFEYMLLNGRAIVIFDGLNELLETSYRQEISGDVESFCTLYPSVPVLVTSREVGYEQAPLDENRFEIFCLAPFDEDQVAEYVRKWFAIETDLTPDQQKQKADGFLEESRIVPDLRSNPLMLALMCNIYRGENYIPRNRPDVYEKCATMLFERWDKSRGIPVTLPFEAHIDPTIKYLANWIYADEKLQGGVTGNNLIAKSSEYLCTWHFDDRYEAERAARGFIEFCRERAWVFTDTGTTKAGERLYQFTHRTFLEYFTAAHLVRTNPTPNSLAAVLLPRIAKREWDVVAQLAFQLQNKNVEGAGNELLTALLKQACEARSEERWNFLSFAARCLEFMVPSPKVIRDISIACIERCSAWGIKRIEQEKSSEHKFKHDKPEELLGALLNAATENRETVAGSLEKLLIERANSGSESESLLALEIGLHLYLPLHRWRMERMPQREIQELWANVSNRISDACSDRIEALSPKHFRSCLDAFWRGKVSISNLIKWHGVGGVFRQCSFIISPNTWWAPPAQQLIDTVLKAPYSPERSRQLENTLLQLEEVGCILLSSPPPWIIEQRSGPVMYLRWFLDKDRFDHVKSESPREPLSLNSDALFGAFTLLAVMLEVSEERKELPEMIKRIKRSKISFFNFMRWIFLAHFEQVGTDKVRAEMNHCGFTAEQQAFAWRWIRREVDLVQRAVRKNKKDQEDLAAEEEPDEP